ncbi:MAG: VOC family protein, partial [Pseudomonas sp.]
MSLQTLAQQPGVAAQVPAETNGFVFNHTMLRVKDIRASLDFYTRVLGFQLIDQRDFAEAQFSLYFLAYVPAGVQVPQDDAERRLWMAGIPGVLELTHNHGTENQDGAIYHDGNSDP